MKKNRERKHRGGRGAQGWFCVVGGWRVADQVRLCWVPRDWRGADWKGEKAEVSGKSEKMYFGAESV